MIAGTFLYFYHAHFQFKTTNHGILVNPPKMMRTKHIKAIIGKKWLVMYVPAMPCNEHCRRIQHNLNQVKLALGKNSDRVNIILSDFDMQSELSATFGKATTQKIYLIDPRGYLFMYYSSDTDPMNILKDLKHLLEVSQIG
jgi:hypothetical protein